MSGRIVLRGVSAVRGVRVGPVRVVDPDPQDILVRRIPRAAIEAERQRLRDAIERTRRDLAAIRTSLLAQRASVAPPPDDGRSGAAPAGEPTLSVVLDAHMLLLSDELLVDAALGTIARDAVCAEAALEATVRTLARRLERVDNSYFRERIEDLEHVARHVRRELAPGGARLIEVDAPVVVVARDLSPADTIRLARSPAIALVTEVGSASSHTALVARSFGLVTVVGVADAGRSVVDGDVVIVDGLAACVVVRPEPAEREAALDRGRRYSAFAESLARREVRANHTADGVRVFIHANLELPDEAPLAVEAGGEGVGLYRTEFLFLGATEPPDEATQLAAYRAVVEAVAPRPVTIRTYDLGGDKVARGGRRDRMREPNPALGLRALRFSLARRDLFITQLRAILRAAEHGRVRVMFPLVTTVGELDEARAALDEAREQLRAEGTAFGEVAFGAMVEVPSAVMLADRFARRVDFLSVGTNDLVQYTFAVDRQNPSVAALASPLDPAILQLLRRVSTDALAADVELSMCGDLAADPFGLPLVIGLGYRCLSVPCGALPLVRAVVARIETDRARLVADEAVRAETPEEVAVLVRDAFGEALGELWTEVGIEQPASR